VISLLGKHIQLLTLQITVQNDALHMSVLSIKDDSKREHFLGSTAELQRSHYSAGLFAYLLKLRHLLYDHSALWVGILLFTPDAGLQRSPLHR